MTNKANLVHLCDEHMWRCMYKKEVKKHTTLVKSDHSNLITRCSQLFTNMFERFGRISQKVLYRHNYVSQ